MRRGVDRVLAFLIAVWAVGMLAGGFVDRAANRLVAGVPVSIWDAVDPATLTMVAVLIAGLTVTAFLRKCRATDWALIALATLLLLTTLAGAGRAAALGPADGPAARTTLGAAFWIGASCAALMVVRAWQRAAASRRAQMSFVAFLAIAIVAMARSGLWEKLSLAAEWRGHRDAFGVELLRHCVLAASAAGLAVLAGVPLGLWAARRPQVRGGIFSTLNLIQTIPSLALFGLLIAPLAALGLPAIGLVPALIALVLYLLLPAARSTAAAIASVDPTVVESARGMGFTAWQILRHVELPLGAPILLAGLRVVAVQALGLSVVAALIGAGGLGSFVFQGLGQYAEDLILLGALPVIGLAVGVDFVLRTLAAPIGARRRA